MPEVRLTLETLRERAAARCAPFAPPPKVELPRLRRGERRQLFETGGGDFEALEGGLVRSARVEGAIDLAIAEGLERLTIGDRLLRLGLRLDDYAREVLDLQPSTAMKRVRLARRLRTRPLLREMIRVGRVSLRAAEVVAPVAKGDGEALWVKRAMTETVRAVEKLVRAEGAEGAADAEEEEWGRLTVGASEEELAVIDEALEVAGQQLPGSRRFEQLEAMAQEWLGGHPEGVPESDPKPLGVYRSSGAREAALGEKKARLEQETERWRVLDRVPRWVATDLRWDEITDLDELDATLRQLGEHRTGWDERVGWAALEISESGLLREMGFASFRHYVEERPGRCLALTAQHFLNVHGPPTKPRTSSQKVRARDRWRCSVPGCSHHAEHAHHIEYLSQGGARTDPANQLALCAFHHTCIHGGYMRLTGTAPGELAWLLRGVPWGMPGWGWAV